MEVEGFGPPVGWSFMTHDICVLQAVSAFAPICNPIQCPWGQKAFSGYLGNDRSTWEVRPPPHGYGSSGGEGVKLGLVLLF